MKAKTIVGLMACAVLAPAFADIDNNKPTTNDWFSASVSGESVYVTGATWNTTPAVEGSTTKVMVIDADVTSPATLTPTTADADTKASCGVVTIASKACLAPSAVADLPSATALGNAQVGFAVATESETTSFYAYTKTSTSGVWTKLQGANPPSTETDTEFTIVLNYNTSKVTFMVGSTPLSVAVASDAGAVNATELSFTPAAAMISDVAAIGSGTITSIDAKFEKAVAVVDNVRYGTIAEAYTAAGNSGTVAVWDPSTGGAADVQTAANGASKAVCMALNVSTTDANAVLTFVPTSETENTIVLETAVDPVDDVTVTFAVSKDGGVASGSYSANGISIPKKAGSYTIVPTVSAKSNP